MAYTYTICKLLEKKKNQNEFLDKEKTIRHARTLNFMNFSANSAKVNSDFIDYELMEYRKSNERENCPKRDMFDRRCYGNCQLNCCNNL